MEKDKDIREKLTEKYGITDEGNIVQLTDLEMREEVLPEVQTGNEKSCSGSLSG